MRRGFLADQSAQPLPDGDAIVWRVLIASRADGDVCVGDGGEDLCPIGCDAGFVDDPAGTEGCVDDDECLRVTCGGNATCRNTPGSFACDCNEGFRADDTNQGGICLDVDECEDPTACGPQEECLNAPGTFACQCAPGFVSNGKDCVDVNECDTDPCSDANSRCENQAGAFQCLCLEGFVNVDDIGGAPGDIICVDVNECDDDPCLDVNSTCENQDGGFRCQCNTGFVIDKGGACVAADECAEDSPCTGFGEVCVDIAGTFTCVCDEGFNVEEDGSCRNIDECEDPTLCVSPSVCIDEVGSFRCQCPTGFEDDLNGGCVDVNECDDPTVCGTNAFCSNEEGSFRCECEDGFVDDAGACVDVDECADDLDDCAEVATCENVEGSFSCTCPEGFSGTGQVCDVNFVVNQCPFPAILTKEAIFQGSGTADGDRFGNDVSLSQDGLTAVAGAPNANANNSAAYVFASTPSGVVQEAEIVTTNEGNDDFGISAAIDGDGKTIVVGALSDATDGSGAGSALVYRKEGLFTWNFDQRLAADVPLPTAEMGADVAISADGLVIAVAAPKDDTAGVDAGRVFIFVDVGGSGTGPFALQDVLEPTNPVTGHGFGANVALDDDGTRLAIRSTGVDTPFVDAGALEIFTRVGGEWELEASIPMPVAAAGMRIGQPVLSGDGSVLAVADFRNDALGADVGAVYVFARTQTTWRFVRALSVPNATRFGERLSMSSDGRAIAALSTGDPRFITVFDIDDVTEDYCVREDVSTAAFDTSAAQFGISLSLSGDGRSLLVGARFFDNDKGTGLLYTAP